MKTATQKIEDLKGLYTFKSPYHEDQRKLPFNVVGNSFNTEYPVKVETVEFRGYTKKESTGDYKIEVIEEYIKSGFLTKVPDPDLNMLFLDQIRNFAHLVKLQPQGKDEFLRTIKDTYSTTNPKTMLFYQATQKSTFESIRLSDNRQSILFNQ